MPVFDFLPDIPTQHILERLKMAGGNEIESGKLLSPQSSAALVVDSFGPFIKLPKALPQIPGLSSKDWPPSFVDIEYQVRFPWSGGRHPWLDAVIKTDNEIIGIESKRFEPYRDSKAAHFSDAYNRDVWGVNMQAYTDVRDALISKAVVYRYLDAAQLVKHAFGLRTEGIMREKKAPSLLYIYIETPHKSPVSFTRQDVKDHQAEISHFSKQVENADVTFVALSYEAWLKKFPMPWQSHAKAVAHKYKLNID